MEDFIKKIINELESCTLALDEEFNHEDNSDEIKKEMATYRAEAQKKISELNLKADKEREDKMEAVSKLVNMSATVVGIKNMCCVNMHDKTNFNEDEREVYRIIDKALEGLL